MYDVCVVGLGKLGLPLAVYFAKQGAKVIGIDINENLVKQVNYADNPIKNEIDLTKYLKSTIQSGSFCATTSYEAAIPSSSVIIVVVPLVTDNSEHPNFVAIDQAVESIGRNLARNTLVILETTLPIGTTSGRIVETLQQTSGFAVGKDLFVAFSPERVLTGRIFEDLERYPKIVGGVEKESGRRAFDFYNRYINFANRNDLIRPNGVWLMKDSSTAEFVKLAETTYRDVNIALANTFSIHAQDMELDISEIIIACNSQPHSHIHDPGISVGGHCIPVYPRLYLSTHEDASLVRIAREINEEMHFEYIKRLQDKVKIEGTRILVYGLSYRPDVKEFYQSGTFELVIELKKRGAIVYVYDPLYSAIEIQEAGLSPFDIKIAEEIDVIIVHTLHSDLSDFLSNFSWHNLRFLQSGRGNLGKISQNAVHKEVCVF